MKVMYAYAYATLAAPLCSAEFWRATPAEELVCCCQNACLQCLLCYQLLHLQKERLLKHGRRPALMRAVGGWLPMPLPRTSLHGHPELLTAAHE